MTAITLLMVIALIVLAGAGITAWARNARKTGANAPGALAGAAVAIAAAGTFAIAPAMPAFAADESHHASDDHAWSADEIVDDASGMLGDDIVWFGQSKLFTKTAAPNDILAAGQSIAVSSCTVSGSIRAAAEDIAIRGADVAHSITLAAKDATVSDTTAQAVAIAAGDASFSGECNALYICAEHAVIDGTVHGDVVVNADSVRLGPNARIEGAVRGSAGDQPEIASSAQHGALELSIHTQDDKPKPAFNAVSTLLAAIYSALACLVTAAAAEWLARKHTANAAQLAKTRTGYLVASGIIGAIAAPVAVIILCCLVITAPRRRRNVRPDRAHHRLGRLHRRGAGQAGLQESGALPGGNRHGRHPRRSLRAALRRQADRSRLLHVRPRLQRPERVPGIDEPQRGRTDAADEQPRLGRNGARRSAKRLRQSAAGAHGITCTPRKRGSTR